MAEDKPQAKASMPFLKNLVGMNVDDESMKSIPYKEAELYEHVTMKTVQAGSVLGSAIGGAYGLIKRRGGVMRSVMNGGRNGMLIGLPLGIVMTFGRMNGLKKNPDIDMDYAYYDRAYRIRNNRNQMRVDRAALAGSLAGATLAMVQGGNIIGSTAVGLALGTVCGGLYNTALAKSK